VDQQVVDLRRAAVVRHQPQVVHDGGPGRILQVDVDQADRLAFGPHPRAHHAQFALEQRLLVRAGERQHALQYRDDGHFVVAVLVDHCQLLLRSNFHSSFASTIRHRIS
jgi:hypothetical protein